MLTLSVPTSIEHLFQWITRYKWYVALGLCLVVLVVIWILDRLLGRDHNSPASTSTDFWTFIENRKGMMDLPHPPSGGRPICERKTEKRCRDIVENLLRVPFPTVRPSFLRYPPSGKNLELDMYNDELGLAFEYQGIQHRKYTPYYHRSMDEFLRQQERDSFKKQRCYDMHIQLVLIPDTIKPDHLEPFLRQKIQDLGIQI